MSNTDWRGIDWRTDSGAEMWWLEHGTTFEFRVKFDEHEFNDAVFTIASRGMGRWAVLWHSFVLDRKLNEFGYEPLPSSRTDKFKKRTRFDSKEEALTALQKYVAATEILPGGMMRRLSKTEIKQRKAAQKVKET